MEKKTFGNFFLHSYNISGI